MKLLFTKLPLFFVILVVVMPIRAQQNENNDFNCFSIVVGKDATVDGSVFVAHNEDDSGDRVVNWYKVPHRKFTNTTEKIELKNGYKLPQVKETFSYLWLELPELEFSDTYMNEFGVTVTSDACKSREDNPELVDGGIGYWLRRLMVERASSAKEAVRLAGNLIDKIGYSSSGRTYVIADAYETWMLSVVYGKHWVAQRIPDNEMAIIPNYYTIKNVNLNDTRNFLGSKDLIDYAIKRGWYNPDTDGRFNFREVYGNPETLKSKTNIARHWVILNMFSEKQYRIDAEFPFSFSPKKKVALQDLFKALRNHYEGTQLDLTDSYKKGNPHHQKAMSVCSDANQYGFVAQLRDWMSPEIGNVLWYAPKRPCVEPFVPVYISIKKIPSSFAITNYQTALKNHFDGIRDYNQFPSHKHIVFANKAKLINIDYGRYIKDQKDYIAKFEKNLLKNQDKFEEKMQELLLSKPKDAINKITEYSLKNIGRIVEEADKL